MQIHLLAVGTKMPAWVDAGYGEYAKRLPPQCALRLVEVAARPRTKRADTQKITQMEGERLLAAVPDGARVIALERTGRPWSTQVLARQLEGWMREGGDTALLVGGPEGLAQECIDAARQRWSLSALTFPHALVRVIVAEQIYRAWSIIRGLPYHR